MIEILLLAIALAMDCFTVSIVCGLLLGRWESRPIFRTAFLFGFFQALMPLIGWFLTSRFSAYLEAYDHWIAFGLLAFLGSRMILDAFKEEEAKHFNPRDLKTQTVFAIATSI
ncbi:MAG: manganese efflux pump, partial [Bacteroidales bacterium]|nr:manganese efflux pump [Bacteroidales bacterium]